jgi:hypothetical protein
MIGGGGEEAPHRCGHAMEIGQHPIVRFNGADIHNCSDRNGMDVHARLVHDVGCGSCPPASFAEGSSQVSTAVVSTALAGGLFIP